MVALSLSLAMLEQTTIKKFSFPVHYCNIALIMPADRHFEIRSPAAPRNSSSYGMADLTILRSAWRHFLVNWGILSHRHFAILTPNSISPPFCQISKIMVPLEFFCVGWAIGNKFLESKIFGVWWFHIGVPLFVGVGYPQKAHLRHLR